MRIATYAAIFLITFKPDAGSRLDFLFVHVMARFESTERVLR
jgi:hypothetical protein